MNQYYLRGAADLRPLTRDLARVVRDRTSRVRRRSKNATADSTLVLEVSSDRQVLGGPFVGLKLVAAGNWGGLAARLAGTYEAEIAVSILDACQTSPTMVFDIGCAEGYYAVGLARLLPQTMVLAFDIEPAARRACRLNGRANGVTNLRCIGRATPRRLESHLLPSSLVLSDCEGYESELLDPDIAPTLRSCTVIAELHEFAAPGVTAEVARRFSATHDVKLVASQVRRTEEWPQLAHMELNRARAAIDEGRPLDPPMSWAVMRPRIAR